MNRKPTRVKRLAGQLRPYLGAIDQRRVLACACGIRHLQQLNRIFPQRGMPPDNVRLTAKIALSALRWIEERPGRGRGTYIPDWRILRLIGRQLVESRTMFAAVSNRVGGGTPRDQIYSYFYERRRNPDGEFVLRLLDFLTLLRSLDRHPVLGPRMETEREWTGVAAALEMEERARESRVRRTGKPLTLPVTRLRFQPSKTPSDILKLLTKKPRSV